MVKTNNLNIKKKAEHVSKVEKDTLERFRDGLNKFSKLQKHKPPTLFPFKHNLLLLQKSPSRTYKLSPKQLQPKFSKKGGRNGTTINQSQKI